MWFLTKACGEGAYLVSDKMNKPIVAVRSCSFLLGAVDGTEAPAATVAVAARGVVAGADGGCNGA